MVSPDFRKDYCPYCGEGTIYQCPKCSADIQGRIYYEPEEPSEGSAPVPDHCEKCGAPYPWTVKKSPDQSPMMIEGPKVEFGSVQPVPDEINPQLKEPKVIQDLTPDEQKSSRTETRNILFMDLSNWSKLSAPKVVDYLNKALPALAKIVQEKYQVTHLNTWGDALVVTFDSSLRAANCALDIREYFRRTPESEGVPEGLVPRLSLHVGEVIIVYNPILKSMDVFGEAVHLAARLEPVTPRGEIYCTESFANGLGSMKGMGPLAHAIGTIKLPKNFGTIKAFAVTGPGESAPLPPNENTLPTEPLDTNPSQVLCVTIDRLLSDWEKEGSWIPDISRVPVDLQVTNSDRGGILVPTKSWTDYEFEFETKIDREYTAWIIRAHDLDNYVLLQCGNGRITPLYRRDGLWWSEKEARLAQPLPEGWFKVLIQVKGDSVSVYQLDTGERTVLFKGDILAPRTVSLEACRPDPNIPNYSSGPVFVSYLRGGVGFRACGHENAYFRNIMVRQIV
jgi:class 3 adenylate cyclase